MSTTVGTSRSGLDYRLHPGAPDSGTRAPIVALHPWFGCQDFWQSVIDRYAERDWIVVDLYSGGRDIAADTGAFDALADAVTDLVAEVANGSVVLAGNSTGGLLAQTIAIAGRADLAALVLIGTGSAAAGVRPPFRMALDEWLTAGPEPDEERTRELVRLLVAHVPDPVAFRRYEDAVVAADHPFMNAVLTSVLGRDITDQLGQITVPTLVVRGIEDNARTQEHVRTLCAGIPLASSVEIPDSGHSPMIDQPEAFTAALRSFLANWPAHHQPLIEECP